MNNASSTPQNIDERIKKAQEVYDSLDVEFIKENNGKYIAVETESGEHFIGNSREEAVSKANKKYPGKVVYVRRIGTIEKVAFHSPLAFNDPYNACLF